MLGVSAGFVLLTGTSSRKGRGTSRSEHAAAGDLICTDAPWSKGRGWRPRCRPGVAGPPPVPSGYEAFALAVRPFDGRAVESAVGASGPTSIPSMRPTWPVAVIVAGSLAGTSETELADARTRQPRHQACSSHGCSPRPSSRPDPSSPARRSAPTRRTRGRTPASPRRRMAFKRA